ncbi:receptor-type tyrosine-protein phosphatase F-like isoform X2 [Hydractinia symbiolongicarpus]|uniref:receptor-type tyrosine-protein phosphatase F-like isoform X2 n=1 Tax=Hydractinia symbiolongicarpus TaxID=13093 RepID=UPI0025503692|nr:receptor-type tyrosine-protein phosphatase F-like isoform X2 [Hydractinia symbiolongicarpus]
MNYVIFTFIFYWSYLVPTTDGCADRTPLGMANGLITADQISNSSMYADYLPSRGRLYSSSSWCGSVGMIDGKSHWFQVDFKSQTTINGIAIQGDPVVARNFITEFRLDFSINGMKWNPFQNGKKFKGNDDNLNVAYNWFTTSMVANHIRLYPTAANIDLPCLRIELYGCVDNEIPLQLGMSSGIIKNTQLESNNGINEAASRLFNSDDGMHRIDYKIPMYLQIDFQKAKTVTGISMQGSFEGWTKKFIKKYNIKYSNDSKTFTLLKQNLGNTDLGADFIPFLEPTTMKYIRITAIDCYHKCGMKVEIYGYDPVCFQTLTQMNIYRRNGSIVPNVDINSPGAWCATDNADFVRITFTKPIIISGIILQGDSNRDDWVKKYKVQYGVTKYELIEDLVGVPARISPLSVNWLNPYIVTNFLHIVPTLCNNGRCCLRFRLKGCQFVLEEPHTIHGSISSSTITFTWKAPKSHPLPVDKYHIRISASKEYENKHKFSFSTINTITTHLSYNVSDINFSAARIQVNITADIQGVKKSAKPYDFYVQPKDPPSPGLTEIFTSNETHNATIVTLTTSSDRNGPISYYEIVISTTRKTNLPNQLTNQTESESKNLDYFRAALIKADDLPTDGIKYSFVEGQENITGLNARISVVGEYYLYARAVIDGNDITKYGFKKMNYFSHLSHEIMIERNALSVFIPRILNDNTPSVRLVKGPSNIKYHFIIIMKVNKTTLQEKEPTLYKQEELETYDTADYNEPYIAGVFNKAQLLNVDEFKLGDNVTYSMPSSTVRKRRSVLAYRNGPLTEGETYVVFQRLRVQDELYSTSWSNQFYVPKIDIKVTPRPVGPTPSPTSSSIGLIAGAAAAGVAVILVIIIVIFYIKRRRRTLKKSSDRRDSSTSIELKGRGELKTHENIIEDDEAGPSDESYYNVAAKPTSPPLSIQQFLLFYLEHKDNVGSDIVKQFKSVPLEHLHEHEVGLKPENAEKNRYLNITAYDHTRVVLQKITGKETSDYINANYIQNYSGQVEYIAAQGPKKGTTFDFWRMVLGEKPAAIVMLANIVEDGRPKCAQYWPMDNGKEVYNGIEVEVTEVQVYADYVIRKIKVGYESNKHQLIHMHFTSWPDHGCPEYPTLLLNFCYRVRQLIPYESRKQILVHCSAGVGRTGTYIIIDAMLHLVRTKKCVDIYNYFESIRQDRVQMVQRVEQYTFVYSAIYEALCCGYTEIMSSAFSDTFQHLISTKEAGKLLVELEFERLNSVNFPFGEHHYVAALLEENTVKNRYPNILARDLSRVYLPHKKNSTDYINAVFVNGYKKKNGIIATQAPLVETLNDFWVVVMEHNVTTIVMLNSTDENYHNYPSFCPVEGSEKFGNVTVNVESNTRVDEINTQCFVVSQNSKHHKVNKLQLNWPNHDVPDCSLLLTLISEVLKSQQGCGDGTILVTCSDGANRSGTFIACMNALDQLKVEQHVDVFQTVRRMRLARPEFVENMRQYQFIYSVLNRYLDSFATYSNFN